MTFRIVRNGHLRSEIAIGILCLLEVIRYNGVIYFLKGITLSELQPMIDLLRDQNFLGSNFVFERKLLIILLFSYLFLASLFSLLTK